LDKIFHPGSVKAVSINGKKISNDIVFKTSLFFFIYFAIFFVSLLLISIDNKDIVSSATAVIASLSNVGPGLGTVGPTGKLCRIFLFFKDCFFVLHDCRTTGIFPGTGFVHSACLEKASDKIKYPGRGLIALCRKYRYNP